MTEVGTLASPAPPDETRPGQADHARVLELLGRMTLEEKLAQIVGFWEKDDGEAVAPLQGEFGGAVGLEEFPGTGSGTSPGPTAPGRWTPASGRPGCGRSSATW